MKVLLAVVVAVAMLLVPDAARACSCCDHHSPGHGSSAPAASPAAAAPLAAGEARARIPVAGMHCHHCASRIEAALSHLAGVRLASASLSDGEAIVVYEKGKVETKQLVEAINALGFEAGTPRS